MIVESQDVYVLTQKISVEFKRNPLDAAVYFIATNDDELKELFGLYLEGKDDNRIVEQRLDGVFDGRFSISYTGLSAPNGEDVRSLIPEIEWTQSQAIA